MPDWVWDIVQYFWWMLIFFVVPAAFGFWLAHVFNTGAGVGAGLLAFGILWAGLTFMLNYTPIQPGAVPFFGACLVALVGLILFVKFV